MQAGGGEAGSVADVVYPGGGLRQIGVRAQNWRSARAWAATPWTCAQRASLSGEFLDHWRQRVQVVDEE